MVNYLLYFTGTAIINQFIDETKVTELRVSTKRMIHAKLTASTQLRVNPKLMINNYCTKLISNLQLKNQPDEMKRNLAKMLL